MSEFWKGLLTLGVYFIVCASSAFICRLTIKIPNELFRKILHFILLNSILVFIFAYQTWWISAIACILIIVIAYPILAFLEHYKSYSETVTERKKGELKNSLILVFLMVAIIIAVCWGYFDNKILALTVIYSWGYGDAFAALIGKKYGKHKIYKSKSIEGTLAMFIVSFFVVFLLLLFGNIADLQLSLLAATLVSPIVTMVELFTPNGLDTVTCPFASLLIMFPILLIGGAI